MRPRKQTFVAFALVIGAFPTLACAGEERLGTVSFSNSCSREVQAPLNRGIALLHDFWYEEAEHQFQQVAQMDANCSIAHWGAAMSSLHQIWDRPSDSVMTSGWGEMQKAQSPGAKTDREREYIAVLSAFYKPGKPRYQARIETYAAGMGKLYALYPDDTDAGAFYALALLAAAPPQDTSLSSERRAMAVLTPLFAKNPDHPGVVHYIIHACDSPALAQQGLAAASHYGEIASSAPHAAHMPGHIFARLGMWKEDIQANLASVAASQSAEAMHLSGALDQLHSSDFLLYAYIQSGQDSRAKEVLANTSALLTHFQAMPDMTSHRMAGMLPYYRTKFPVFSTLEMRDWKAAVALQPVAEALPESQTLTYWARIIGAGHLRDAHSARANLATYNDLMARVRKGPSVFLADSTGAAIEHGEALAWTAFAEGDDESALRKMRESADLQDKVGQGEVDIPAREMLADMFLELHQPERALVEYDISLKMSPNRFNGLLNAGMAAEAAGDKTRAARYYTTLLTITSNGSLSARPELAHVKSLVSSMPFATK